MQETAWKHSQATRWMTSLTTWSSRQSTRTGAEVVLQARFYLACGDTGCMKGFRNGYHWLTLKCQYELHGSVGFRSIDLYSVQGVRLVWEICNVSSAHTQQVHYILAWKVMKFGKDNYGMHTMGKGEARACNLLIPSGWKTRAMAAWRLVEPHISHTVRRLDHRDSNG